MIPKLPELKSRCIYENGMEELECELCGDTFYQSIRNKEKRIDCFKCEPDTRNIVIGFIDYIFGWKKEI